MLISFRPDKKTAFNDLMDGRLNKYEIETVKGDADIYGNSTGTLIYEERKVLVRSDKNGNITRLIPTAQDVVTVCILTRVGAELEVAFDAVNEDVGDFLEFEPA
jgi:hypothetical protein